MMKLLKTLIEKTILLCLKTKLMDFCRKKFQSLKILKFPKFRGNEKIQQIEILEEEKKDLQENSKDNEMHTIEEFKRCNLPKGFISDIDIVEQKLESCILKGLKIAHTANRTDGSGKKDLRLSKLLTTIKNIPYQMIKIMDPKFTRKHLLSGVETNQKCRDKFNLIRGTIFELFLEI